MRQPHAFAGAVPLEQLDSVGREVPSGVRRADDEVHAGGYRCEAAKVETGEAQPIETAVRGRGGGRAEDASLRCKLSQKAGHWLLVLDCSNAFDTVNRVAVLEDFALRAPALTAFAMK